METISIVTITQYSRFASLCILYEIIQLQDYPNILEWIIVEGSPSSELRSENIKNIENLIKNNSTRLPKIRFITPFTPFRIEDAQSNRSNLFISAPEEGILNENWYNHTPEDVAIDEFPCPISNIHHCNPDIIPLSNLRNLGNDHCSCDIIVCMDDDDYYHPEYVSYIVERFQKYNRLIAGCSPIYMYDFFSDKLYKFKGFHKNHTTNNCMAYRKEYLENHRYKEGLLKAEEYSFTNGFTEPMIQLKPEKCIIVSIHRYNTINKDDFISVNNDSVMEINDKITNRIPEYIFLKMKDIFINDNKYKEKII